MAPQAAAAAPSSTTHVRIPFLACAVCHGLIEANATSAADSTATTSLDADLHPLDSELAIEIRAMFLAHWNMDATQADARMAQFNYDHAIVALPVPSPGAIGSAFGGGIYGGAYAGIIRGVNGAPDEHLVLLDGEAEAVTWDAAGSWAASQGGELPTRAEQRLLLANLPTQFKPDWYWSGEQAGPLTRGFRISTVAARTTITARTRAAPAPSADFQFNPLSISA